jgi:hypothetical protein
MTLHQTFQLYRDGVTEGRVMAALWAFAVAQLAGATRDADKDNLAKRVLRSGDADYVARTMMRALLSYAPVGAAPWVNDAAGDVALSAAVDTYVGPLLAKGVLNLPDPDAPPAP